LISILSVGNEENQEKPGQGSPDPTEIQTGYLSNRSQDVLS